MSGKECYQRLKDYLIRASDQVRVHKVETRTLFSATHFAAFFKFASEHFARTFREPFGFEWTDLFIIQLLA